jgi:hypothetical protein
MFESIIYAEGERMTNHDGLIDTYITSLFELDEGRRRELIEQVWQGEGTFVSPFSAAKGHHAIDHKIAQIILQFPGLQVRRTSPIEVLHHNYVRFAFEAAQGDADPFSRGVDFGVIVDGKLQLVAGFFDVAPSPED